MLLLGKRRLSILEAKSEKGEKLLNSLSTLLEDGSTSDLEELKKSIKEKLATLPLKNLNPKKITKAQQEIFDYGRILGRN